jgi:hypothetical protein
MANPNFTDIVTTTLQGYSKQLADNITNHNALLRAMERKGNKKVATGRTIVQELEFEENSTVMYYSGAEILDISASETFTAAEFNYKQLAGNVVITGLEEIQNSGKEAVHNLLRSRIRNLEKSLKNTMATSLYANGTGFGGKDVGGLQLLVADVPTNTVGGIDANANTWWRNQVYDFSDKSIVASATTIQAAMNSMYLDTVRGADRTDMIVADRNYYTFYWESLQANQRFTDDKEAGAGFTNVVYHGNIPVIYDDQCPTNHMYFLNTDYLFMRPAKGREFVPLGEKSAVNQDALVMPVVWAGNLTVSNRARQGVIVA